jgi:putative PIN family toxin of toxin-antitoxin system
MSPAPGAERLKVVLDTNIYVGAFAFPKGGNAVVWLAALEGRFRLLVSPAILAELAEALRFKFGWQDERVQKAVRIIAQVARVVAPCTVLQVVAADPDDDKIIECAVDGKADVIVSNDRHLLDLKTYAGIPVVTSRDFRRTLGLK